MKYFTYINMVSQGKHPRNKDMDIILPILGKHAEILTMCREEWDHCALDSPYL